MNTQTDTGRNLVLAVIAATLTFSVLVIITLNIVPGPERFPQQIVRFLLTAGLCVFLYRGANWARWVAGILFILGGLHSLLVSLTAPSMGLAVFLLLIMGIIYAASAFILLVVPTVQTYFSGGKVKAGKRRHAARRTARHR